MEELKEQIKNYVEQKIKFYTSKEPKGNLIDLGLDSLEIIETVMEMESTYKINMTEIYKIDTVEELKEEVYNKIIEKRNKPKPLTKKDYVPLETKICEYATSKDQKKGKMIANNIINTIMQYELTERIGTEITIEETIESLDTINLIMEAEKRFNINLEEEYEISNLKNLIDKISEQI